MGGILNLFNMLNSGSGLAASASALAANVWNIIQSVLPHH